MDIKMKNLGKNIQGKDVCIMNVKNGVKPIITFNTAQGMMNITNFLFIHTYDWKNKLKNKCKKKSTLILNILIYSYRNKIRYR